MRRLIPDPGPTDLESELSGYRPWELTHEDRPWVAVNMVTTIDGRASVDGRSKQLGSQEDTNLLLGLRTRFDAVMIGAGTMRAERYGPIVRDPEARQAREELGLSPIPTAILVSGDLDLPWDAPLFTSGEGKVIVYTCSDSRGPLTETPVRMVNWTEGIEIDRLVRSLKQVRSFNSVLCEGGPRLLGQLVAAGLVDELFLTVTPVMAGGVAPRILEGDLPELAGFELTHLLESDGDLFTRYRRA